MAWPPLLLLHLTKGQVPRGERSSSSHPSSVSPGSLAPTLAFSLGCSLVLATLVLLCLNCFTSLSSHRKAALGPFYLQPLHFRFCISCHHFVAARAIKDSGFVGQQRSNATFTEPSAKCTLKGERCSNISFAFKFCRQMTTGGALSVLHSDDSPQAGASQSIFLLSALASQQCWTHPPTSPQSYTNG